MMLWSWVIRSTRRFRARPDAGAGMGSADGLSPARAALSGEGGSPVRRSTHPSSLLVVAVEDRLLGLRRLVEGRLRVLAFDQDAVDHVDGDLALAGLVHEKRPDRKEGVE